VEARELGFGPGDDGGGAFEVKGQDYAFEGVDGVDEVRVCELYCVGESTGSSSKVSCYWAYLVLLALVSVRLSFHVVPVVAVVGGAVMLRIRLDLAKMAVSDGAVHTIQATSIFPSSSSTTLSET